MMSAWTAAEFGIGRRLVGAHEAAREVAASYRVTARIHG
jgi:hypothetical protein